MGQCEGRSLVCSQTLFFLYTYSVDCLTQASRALKMALSEIKSKEWDFSNLFQ